MSKSKKVGLDPKTMSAVFYPNGNSTIIENVNNVSLIPCTGNETVALIQDVVPWDLGLPLGANVIELEAQGKNFCILTSDEIGSVDLSRFKEILIASGQTQTFYDNLFPGGIIHDDITTFVENGGVLSANLFDFASGPGNGGIWEAYEFVGGLRHVIDIDPFIEDLIIADPSHLIITGAIPCPSGNCGQIVDQGPQNDLDGWFPSSIGYFTNLPSGTTIILTDNSDRPVMIEYSFGSGVVIAILTLPEWMYTGGYPGFTPMKKLLANEIAYQDHLIRPTRGIIL
jgi:hypothetical protein